MIQSQRPIDYHAGMSRAQRMVKPDQANERLLIRSGFPLLVGAAALTIFVWTLAPTVTAEDSGELIAAAWHFGIPHPPGYPLWTMLCGIFTHAVPVGSIAVRANLFSALCSAAAAVAAYAALRELRRSRPGAAATALGWVWSRWSWSQSVITEVYALNSLLTALVLWCVLSWYRTGSTRSLIAGSLVFGLGMSNHHVIALAGIALAVWAVARRPKRLLRWRLVLCCAGAFLIGLIPYVYLPIRASVDPPINWGDPSTTQRFWEHVTRHQYGAVGPIKTVEPRTPARLNGQLRYLAVSLVDDLTPWLAVTAAIGLAIMLRRHRWLALLVVLWFACTGIVFVWLANFDLDRTSRWAMRVFLIPVSLGLVIPIGIFLESLTTWIQGRLRRTRAVGTVIAGLAIISVPAVQLSAHWSRCDYSDYWYAQDHAENLLNCMAPRALLFPTGDHNTFPLVYALLVEGKRPDVRIADMYGYVDPALCRDRPVDAPEPPAEWLIRRARRPVYYTTKISPPVSNASFVPAGMLYHLLPDHMTFEGQGLLQRCAYRNTAAPTVLDHGAAHIMADYFFFAGLDALTNGETEGALRHFQQSAAYGVGIKEVYNNIGSALGEYGLDTDAEHYFRRAADLDWRYTMPRWNLFRLYKRRNQWADARRQLEALIRATPDDHRPYGELGFILERYLDDRRGAVRAWQHSLKRNPNQPQIIGELARINDSAGGRGSP